MTKGSSSRRPRGDGGVLGWILDDKMKLSWQLQLSLYLIPTLAYGLMFLGQHMPKSEASKKGLSFGEMFKDVGILGALGLGLGSSHSCAIKADSTVACWGFSHRGQAGVLPPFDCSTESCVVGVTDVPNLGGVTRLALGASHSCAATADGFAYCWGDNQAGQLGINSQGPGGPTPVIVRTLFAGIPISNVVDMAASGNSTCALRDPGGLYCWGTPKAQ